jgi:hypothetical protein
MATSQAIGADDIRDGRCFHIGWLRRHGMPASRRDLKIPVNGWKTPASRASACVTGPSSCTFQPVNVSP